MAQAPRAPYAARLVIMLVFVGAILVGLFFTPGASISRFTERLGLSNFDLQEVVTSAGTFYPRRLRDRSSR